MEILGLRNPYKSAKHYFCYTPTEVGFPIPGTVCAESISFRELYPPPFLFLTHEKELWTFMTYISLWTEAPFGKLKSVTLNLALACVCE